MDDAARYYGQVKWFKDHKGYGFISVLGRCDGAPIDEEAREIFVHHTDLHPATSTYKTLLKGEYVSFGLKRVLRARGATSDSTVDTQAADVRGAYGGGLMCDGLNVSALTRGECAPLVLHNGDIMFGSGEDVIL